MTIKHRVRLAAALAAVALVTGGAVVGWLVWPGNHPAAAITIRCPDRDDPHTSPNQPNADLATLVPGQPTGATVCRYHGQDDAPSLPRTRTSSTPPHRQPWHSTLTSTASCAGSNCRRSY
jgi:hypothetical protein